MPARYDDTDVGADAFPVSPIPRDCAARSGNEPRSRSRSGVACDAAMTGAATRSKGKEQHGGDDSSHQRAHRTSCWAPSKTVYVYPAGDVPIAPAVGAADDE